jgi:hypothetical protein
MRSAVTPIFRMAVIRSTPTHTRSMIMGDHRFSIFLWRSWRAFLGPGGLGPEPRYCPELGGRRERDGPRQAMQHKVPLRMSDRGQIEARLGLENFSFMGVPALWFECTAPQGREQRSKLRSTNSKLA